jgi:hypothetical protein
MYCDPSDCILAYRFEIVFALFLRARQERNGSRAWMEKIRMTLQVDDPWLRG